MKKLVFMLVITLFTTQVSYAQNVKKMAKEQSELNEIHMRLLKGIKPNKAAKKEAKRLKKEGWLVPVGEKSIEQQLMRSYLYAEEFIPDEYGTPTKRFYQHTAMTTAGSYSSGFMSARVTAHNEIAAMIKSELFSSVIMKLENRQVTSVDATSAEQLNIRMQSVVDEVLTGIFTTVAMFRRLENGNVEVTARFAFDKKELATRLKRNLRHVLKEDDEGVDAMIDEMIRVGL